MFKESLVKFQEIGYRRGVGWCYHYLGKVTYESKDYIQSQQNFREALKIAQKTGDLPMTLSILVGCAALFVREGRQETALELVYHALDHPAADSATRDMAKQLLRRLEKKLSTKVIKKIKKRVQTRKFKDVVEEIYK